MSTRRSLFVASGLLAFVAIVAARPSSRADAPRPCEPSRFALFGEDSYFTAGESPDHVFFHVESRSESPVTIDLRRIVLVASERETTMTIHDVIDDATGERLNRRFSLGRDERRRLRVHVDVPVRGRSYLFRGTFADGSCRYDAESNVVYAHRTPIPTR